MVNIGVTGGGAPARCHRRHREHRGDVGQGNLRHHNGRRRASRGTGTPPAHRRREGVPGMNEAPSRAVMPKRHDCASIHGIGRVESDEGMWVQMVTETTQRNNELITNESR
jgi:hypothetical protein